MTQSTIEIPEQPDPIDVRNRIEAERITAHWRTGNTMALPDYSVGPLFLGGEQQRGLFAANQAEGEKR